MTQWTAMVMKNIYVTAQYRGVLDWADLDVGNAFCDVGGAGLTTEWQG